MSSGLGVAIDCPGCGLELALTEGEAQTLAAGDVLSCLGCATELVVTSPSRATAGLALRLRGLVFACSCGQALEAPAELAALEVMLVSCPACGQPSELSLVAD